jgi:PAS domain-containing protein
MHNQEPDFTDPLNRRSQAEKILQLKKEKKTAPDLGNEADAQKLVHELQVHQIELEMQNEELLQVYETAEAALKKYTLIFDQAPIGFISINSDGTITELNFSAAEMLGDRRFSLLGTNLKLHITEGSRSDFNSFFKKTYETNRKEVCRICLVNQPAQQVYIEGIVIENDDYCLLSLVDISRFK